MTKIATKPLLKTSSGLLLAVLVLTALGISLDKVNPGITAQENALSGEKVVHLLQEPRHRTVHRAGGLFLLDVQVNPGDESFQHIHDQAILLTSISSGAGPSNGTVRAITDYATTPLTHNVSNGGPGLLRIIALVNAGSGVAGEPTDRPSGMSSNPDIENSWFRSYRIELDPGEETLLQTHRNSTVIIQGTQGTVHVTREDGITAELDMAGDWAWRDANSPFTIQNRGQTSVAVAINEGRE